MLIRAVAEVTLPDGDGVRSALEVAGEPIVALLVGVVTAIVLLGLPAGMDRHELSRSIGGSLPPIAGILLIVGAGGGFKQTLIDADPHRDRLGHRGHDHRRRDRGSARRGTGCTDRRPAGARRRGGSLFFSHVNDAGFWLVKEYFGLTVGQTIKSWSMMETVISVVGLLVVLLLSVIVRAGK